MDVFVVVDVEAKSVRIFLFGSLIVTDVSGLKADFSQFEGMKQKIWTIESYLGDFSFLKEIL